jgi:hypothetical protein
MLPIHVALVSRTDQTTPAQLSHVAAALQMQAIRDVGPLWSLTATVDAFARLGDVPVGSWPVAVVDDVQGAAGFHLDSNGQPYALVEYSDSWSLTASHETVEMIVDPWGRRIAPGRSPKSGQGQVEFLVEACDPCEAAEFGYTINGVLVSDFITPQFYDPRKTVAARYSFTGAVTRPRQILRGGYISWHDPASNHIWQQLWLGAEKEFRDLGEGDFAAQGSLRGFVDANTEHPDLDHGLPEDDETLADARVGWTGAIDSAEARGTRLEAEIDAVLSS